MKLFSVRCAGDDNGYGLSIDEYELQQVSASSSQEAVNLITQGEEFVLRDGEWTRNGYRVWAQEIDS